jgi:hypothetical protein
MGGLSHIFGGGGPTPVAPAPPPVVAMPDINSPDVQNDVRLRQSQLRAAGGRQSTMLTGPGSGNGAPTYLNNKLGA